MRLLPFGLEIDRNNLNQTPAARNAVNRYSFLGKETQVATGYIDLQERFYDPTIGRFMAVDPETEGQDEFSPYHYSYNNPIRFSDPDGRFPFVLPLLPYIAAAGVISAAVVTTVYGGAVLLKKGIEAGVSGGAFSPGTGAAMSLSTPGELNGWQS